MPSDDTLITIPLYYIKSSKQSPSYKYYADTINGSLHRVQGAAGVCKGEEVILRERKLYN